jgi:uncharacterized membrane protein
MAACSKCGSVVAAGAAFCSVCGSPVSVVSSTVAPPPPPPPQPQIGMATASAGLNPNVAGALAYLVGLITGIIFLVLEPYKNDRFVRFHAFQSIFLNVAMIIFGIIWSAILGMLIFSLGLLSIVSLFGTLVYLAFFVLWIVLMFKAYNNQMFKLPIIGDFAEKQADK